MPVKSKLSVGHFAMHARDMKKMEDFYTDVVGLTVTDRGTVTDADLPMIFMSADPTEHHQFVLIGGRPDDDNFQLNHHLAFIVESLDDLRAIHERAAATDGIDDLRCMTHGNAWSVYFNDPEANGVECYVPTPWHVAQPNIHPFDLNKSDQEIRTETEELCRSGDHFMSAGDRQVEMARMMEKPA